jgi:hypothetical protein
MAYIQQKINRDLQASLSGAIAADYRSLYQTDDPLARLKQSPLIASFPGEPDLAERSEALFRSLIDVESLPPETQEVLVTLMRNRWQEQRRAILLATVAESERAFAADEVKRGPVADLWSELGVK